jgi:hypothetical protein
MLERVEPKDFLCRRRFSVHEQASVHCHRRRTVLNGGAGFSSKGCAVYYVISGAGWCSVTVSPWVRMRLLCPKTCRVNLDRPMNLGNRLACLPRIVHSLTLRSRVQEYFTANLERMFEHVQSRVGRVLSLKATNQRKLKRMVYRYCHCKPGGSKFSHDGSFVHSSCHKC